MMGERPAAGPNKKYPLRFVVAYRIDEDVTGQLMRRSIESGFQPEQIARYALKKYLAELASKES